MAPLVAALSDGDDDAPQRKKRFVPEQDDFEGLPVRQWRRQWVTVATTPPNDTNEEGDIWAEDPSHGMPKDSHLLIPCLQELLRAGRSINFGKRPAPDDDDDGDYDGYGVVEKREEEEENQGFMIQTWKQVPRTAETPSTSHLAKRHKNTITLSSKVGVPSVTGPTVTRATVRRIDAAGNPYEQTITLTEGQKVDGEIISTTVVPASQPKAQDTELSTNQPTPNRRRPPPPKRKPPRGPGRGRKKRLPLPLPLPATRSQQHADHDGSPDVKTEGDPEEAARTDDNEDSTMQDSEMADESGFQSDDDAEGVDDDMDPDDTAEAQDGAADEPTPEVGELGDNTEVAADLVQEQYQDQDQDQDHEMLDSDATEILQPSSVEEPDDAASSPAGGPGVRRSSSGEEELTISKPRFQPSLGLGALASFGSPRVEGSPLKNVMTHSPPDRRSPVLAGASPSADLASAAAAAAPSVSAKAEESFDSPGVPMDVDMTDDAHSQVGVEVIKTVKMEETEEPPLHFQPEASVVGETTTPPVVTKQNDTLPESAAAVSAVTVTETTTTTTTTVVMDDSVLPAAEEGDATMASPVHLSAPVPAAVGPELQVPELSLPPIDSGSVSGVAVEGAAEQAEGEADGEDDDDGLNLLGSLEAELDRQESLSNAPGSRADTPKQQQQQQPLPAGAAAAVEGEDGAEKDDESGEMKDVVEGRDETGTDVNKEPEDVQHEMKDAEEKDQIESDATEEEMKKGVAGGEGDETAAESDINKEVEDVQHEMKDDVGEREDQNKSTGSDDGSEGVNDAEDVEKIKDVVVDDLADMETVAKEDAKDVKEGDADTGGMGAAIATEESEAGGQAS